VIHNEYGRVFSMRMELIFIVEMKGKIHSKQPELAAKHTWQSEFWE